MTPDASTANPSQSFNMIIVEEFTQKLLSIHFIIPPPTHLSLQPLGVKAALKISCFALLWWIQGVTMSFGI